MNITRRQLLTFAGGSVVGALFTPIPWKLLDDSAIWTQNWSLIPKLPRGPEMFRYTACALCPGGCAVKARLVNGRPVGLVGAAGHPAGRGILCAAGISAHHLASHPLRLSQPYAFTGKEAESKLVPVSADHAAAEIARTMREIRSSTSRGTMAVLDQRPGRAISRFYQEFLGTCPGSQYIAAPGSEETTLRLLGTLCNITGGSPGYDFENCGTIMSFGAPLLDGWSTPQRMLSLLQTRKQTGLRLIQAEGVQSRTALQADAWLPVVPGTERFLAMAIACTIIREKLHPASVETTTTDFAAYKEAAATVTPEAVAGICGIPSGSIIETARALAAAPSIVMSGYDPAGGPFDTATETAIAGLNILLGNIGRKGGILLRTEVPSSTSTRPAAMPLADVPDHSIRLLIVDASESGCTYPVSLLKKKLVPDGATVVMMAPYLTARAGLADYLVPSPAAFESPEEVSTPPGASQMSFALAMPLMRPPETAVDPIAFLVRVAAFAGLPPAGAATTEACLKQRAGEIWLSKRGFLTGPAPGTRIAVQDIASETELWKGLAEGGFWVDNTTRRPDGFHPSLLGSLTPRDFLLPSPYHGSLRLVPFGWKNATMTAGVAPIMSKVFQESHLRTLGGRVNINPATLASSGLADGTPVTITTPAGSMTGYAVADPSVIPGIIHAAVGPSPNNAASKDQPEAEGFLALCSLNNDGSWRITEATIAKA